MRDSLLTGAVVLFLITFFVAPVVMVWRNDGAVIGTALMLLIGFIAWAQSRNMRGILKGLGQPVPWRSIAYGVVVVWILALLSVWLFGAPPIL